MRHSRREKYERPFLTLARAVTVGFSYVLASPIPGLTSSFVAIFMSLLPFDLMVAAPRPLLGRREWRQFLVVVLPRLRSTAVTLLKGVAIGAACGTMVVLGMPALVGSALTAGLAYIWAIKTPHNISAYVAMMSGLSVFEVLSQLRDFETPAELEPYFEAVLVLKGTSLVLALGYDIVLSAGGTFLGMGIGWFVGAAVGMVTRMFLSRPYRSLQSHAYEPPITKKPLDEVLAIGDRNTLITGRVAPESTLAHRSLVELRLRERYGATVLSVRREQSEAVAPPGSLVLLPGDEVLILADNAFIDQLHALLQGAAPGAAPAPPVPPPAAAPPAPPEGPSAVPTEAPSVSSRQAPPTPLQG